MSQIVSRIMSLIVCIAIALFGGFSPLPTQAANHVPSIEITGLPNNTGCSVTDYTITVPVYYNTTASSFDKGQLVINGNVEASTSHKHEAGQGTVDYKLSEVQPTSFDVADGTPITITITTYFGPDEADGKSFESVIVYTCGTNTIISLTQTVNTPGSDGGEVAIGGPGPDMITLPSEAVVGTFTAPTPLYFTDDAISASMYHMEAGQSLWVLGINEAGTFYKVVLSGQMFWVPRRSIGPNYDNLWQGTPLPITVVS